MDLYEHVYDAGDGSDATTLVLLHGTGGNAAEFARLGRMAAPGAALLALEGNVDEYGQARFFRRRAEGVYDMEDLARRTDDLAGFLEAALSRHGRDPARAVGIGYSNGANILANLLFTRPAALSGYALMHPLIPFTPADNAAIRDSRVLITAGARDPIAPQAGSRALAEWLTGQGAGVDLYVHEGGHELRAEEVDRLRQWLARPGTVAATATSP